MLKAKRLSYYRNGSQVFSGVSFDIKIGTCLFIKGLNGSGKTTLLKMLAGFIPIQKGVIRLNGKDATNNYDVLDENIDYIGHFNAMKKQMTAWDNLTFWNRLCEQSNQVNLEEDFNDLMSITDFKNQQIEFCSVGQIRRIALARLNTSNKKVWLLDEPTSSLDGTAVNNFNKMIKKHCNDGGIAIITSHHALKIPEVLSQSLELSKKDVKQNNLRSDPFLTGDW